VPGGGEPGQDPGIALPADQRLQHRPAGDAEDVADHGRQRDLRVFQQLLRPLLLPGPLAIKVRRQRHRSRSSRCHGGGQPPPIFPPAGRPRRDTDD
jgi:hypothetical protein